MMVVVNNDVLASGGRCWTSVDIACLQETKWTGTNTREIVTHV